VKLIRRPDRPEESPVPVPSPHHTIEIPEVSVFDLLFAGLTPEEEGRVAVTDSSTGSVTTYGELRDRVDAFAGALTHRGLGVGDVVALHAPNSLAFVVAFHGIMRAGATVTTVGALGTAQDIAKQVIASGASLMLTVGALGTAGAEGAEEAGLDEDAVIDLVDEANGLASLLAEGHAAPEVEFDPATHIAVLPFSSGTTGVPKGVELSHRNLVANIVQCGPLLMANGQFRRGFGTGVVHVELE
jgi:acyl-CoA synthetase (AMP-forming)/AMP-acid ligase II